MARRDVQPVTCTCAGCPPKPHRILAHAWQDRLWFERHVYEPCTAEPRSGCCGCYNDATQEDLLCDGCRERGGVSVLDSQRIVACLTARVTG